MVTQNAYNHRNKEHLRTDDVQEDAIKIHTLNSTAFERHLVRHNVGKVRRQKNGHAERLARYKAN